MYLVFSQKNVRKVWIVYLLLRIHICRGSRFSVLQRTNVH